MSDRLDPAGSAAAERAPAEFLARSALGTIVALVVADPARRRVAAQVLDAELVAVELACDRSRADSELSRIDRRCGPRVCRVGPVLGDVLTAAAGAAERMGGLDPTRAAGGARPGWWQVGWDPGTRLLRLPVGLRLDLDACARAVAADRIAARVAEQVGCGAMVTVGRCVAVAGAAGSAGGWFVGVADDPAQAPLGSSVVVALGAGGLATARAEAGGGGEVAGSGAGRWRAVTVVGSSCVVADEASRAALRGDAAAAVALEARGLAARLLAVDGSVVVAGGWDALVAPPAPPIRRAPWPRSGMGGCADGTGPGRRRRGRAGGGPT